MNGKILIFLNHLTYWSTKNWWWQPHFLVFNKIQNTRQHHFETNKRSNFDCSFICSISQTQLEGHRGLIQFVIFKPLSYCFEEAIGFDLKASFASRPMLRLISWYSKPGDITKEYWEKAIQFRGNFHWLKITNWTTNFEALDSRYLRAFLPIFRKTFSFLSLYDELQVRQVSLLTVNHKHFRKMHWICSTLAL